MKKYLVLLALTACATPYQQHSLLGGYEDHQIGPHQYVITFEGNGYTSSARTQSYALRRAYEVCIRDGFSSFVVINGRSEVSVSAYWNQYGGGVVSRPNAMITIRCTDPARVPRYGSPAAVGGEIIGSPAAVGGEIIGALFDNLDDVALPNQ